MKKLLITLGSIMFLAIVVVLFVNATEPKQDIKKTNTEIQKDEASVQCPSACKNGMGQMKAKCNSAECKGTNCDPATCKGVCKSNGGEAKICDPAACAGHGKGMMMQ